MRFDEPDMREAYRLGARDCFESMANSLPRRQAREIEAWLKELESWDYSDPPTPPLGR
jgi:hypothetical protein